MLHLQNSKDISFSISIRFPFSFFPNQRIIVLGRYDMFWCGIFYAAQLTSPNSSSSLTYRNGLKHFLISTRWYEFSIQIQRWICLWDLYCYGFFITLVPTFHSVQFDCMQFHIRVGYSCGKRGLRIIAFARCFEVFRTDCFESFYMSKWIRWVGMVIENDSKLMQSYSPLKSINRWCM